MMGGVEVEVVGAGRSMKKNYVIGGNTGQDGDVFMRLLD